MSVVAFSDRSGNFIFVPDPERRGRYIRTSWIVAIVPCPACKSEPGVPCHGYKTSYGSGVHADRLVAARDAERETGCRVKHGDDPPVLREDILDDEEKIDEGGPIKTSVDLREMWK